MKEKNGTSRKKQNKRLRYFTYLIIWFLAFLILLDIKFFELLPKEVIPGTIYLILLDYSILIYLLLAIVAILIFGLGKVISFLIGLLSFPLYLLFWFLPKKSFKMALSACSLLSRAASFTNTMTYKIALVLIFVLSSYIIFSIDHRILIIISMAFLLLVLGLHLARRFYTISKPVILFHRIEKLLFNMWEKYSKNTISQGIKEWKQMDSNDANYKEKWRSALNALWFSNRIFYRFAQYLKKLEGNRFLAAYFIFAVSLTLFLTILIFGIEYYALIKLSEDSVRGIAKANILDCLYFSFTTITTVNFGDILPVNGAARGLVLLEIICGMLILVILFFVFTTVTLEKYKRDLDEFVNSLEHKEHEIKKMIEVEYGKKIGELLPELVSSTDQEGRGYKFIKLDEDELPE